MHMTIDEDYIVCCRKESSKWEKVADKLTKEWDYVRSCACKVRYKDCELAKKVLNRYPEQRIYKCSYCKGWHLARKSKYVLRIENEVMA